MKDLNKKIAEWCGFEFSDDWSAIHPYKDNRGIILHNSLDFTTSLDACFEYIVPKVLEKYNIEYYSFKQASGLYYSEVQIWREGDTQHSFKILRDELIARHFEQGEDLKKITALALCRAVEKLIDKSIPNPAELNDPPAHTKNYTL